MLGNVVALALGALALAVMAPVGVLLAQAIAGALPARRRPEAPPPERRARVAVLIPAHDEAALVGRACASAREQLRPGDRLLVVAHNCADGTADAAAAAGAEVALLRDPARAGKGYALAAGLARLDGPRAPAVVLVLDADCVLGARAVDTLAQACLRWGAPAQALYAMAPARADAHERLSLFAWRIRTQLRPRGYARLGLPCHLMGTGMAFPWALISAADLASPHVTEDVLLGLDLALQGAAPRFCPEARVTSELPPSAAGRELQRRRWIHGYLQLQRSHLGRLLRRAYRDRAALALAADLIVPPLGLLALACVALWPAVLLAALVTGWRFPLVAATLDGVGLLAFLALCWIACGRDLVGLRELARIPAKISSALAVMVSFAAGKRAEWNRAQRR